MLLVHQNPHNTDRNPKVINTYQTVYERTGVDLNSRWLVEWKGLCQGQLLSDLSCPGHRDATAILQCEQGDLVVECESRASGTYIVLPAAALTETDPSRPTLQGRDVPRRPPPRPVPRSDHQEDDVPPSSGKGEQRSFIRGRRGRKMHQGGKDRVREDDVGGEQDRSGMV